VSGCAAETAAVAVARIYDNILRIYESELSPFPTEPVQQIEERDRENRGRAVEEQRENRERERARIYI
jgi:hypothetical protein